MFKHIMIDGRFLTKDITGVQRVGVEFCQALDQLCEAGEFPDLQISVIVSHRANLSTIPHWRNIRLLRVGRLSGHLWEQVELPIIARKAVLLCLENTAPVISLIMPWHQTNVMVHDLSYHYYPHAYRRSFRIFYEMVMPLVLRLADNIFTVSASEKAAITSAYPMLRKRTHIVVAANGASTLGTRPIVGRQERRRHCLYVGSLTKRKNAEGLLTAAALLVQEHNATFTFVGANGPDFEGIRIDLSDDVKDHIRFLGQINDKDQLASEYEQSAVFVFPSFYESSGLPPTEAMGYGCPVVVSSIPSLQERCANAAVYCNPHDVNSIVDSVSRLLDSEQLWHRQQQAGLDRASCFSWTAQAELVISTILQNSR